MDDALGYRREIVTIVADSGAQSNNAIKGSSMSRLTTFLLGVVVGGASLFIAENYYIVRSTQSFHLVPKIAAKLEFPYHDIRNYSIEDWKKNVSLGAAIVKAKKPDMMVESLTSVEHNFESILKSLGGGS